MTERTTCIIEFESQGEHVSFKEVSLYIETKKSSYWVDLLPSVSVILDLPIKFHKLYRRQQDINPENKGCSFLSGLLQTLDTR